MAVSMACFSSQCFSLSSHFNNLSLSSSSSSHSRNLHLKSLTSSLSVSQSLFSQGKFKLTPLLLPDVVSISIRLWISVFPVGSCPVVFVCEFWKSNEFLMLGVLHIHEFFMCLWILAVRFPHFSSIVIFWVGFQFDFLVCIEQLDFC